MRHAAEYADQWCPISSELRDPDGRIDVPGSVERFRALVAEHGRDPADIPITLFVLGRPPARFFDRIEPLGIERVVLGGGTELDNANTTLRLLDALSELI